MEGPHGMGLRPASYRAKEAGNGLSRLRGGWGWPFPGWQPHCNHEKPWAEDLAKLHPESCRTETVRWWMSAVSSCWALGIWYTAINSECSHSFVLLLPWYGLSLRVYAFRIHLVIFDLALHFLDLYNHGRVFWPPRASVSSSQKWIHMGRKGIQL